MDCPRCAVDDSKVIDTKHVRKGRPGPRVRRRRSCCHCKMRWTTYEMPQDVIERLGRDPHVGDRQFAQTMRHWGEWAIATAETWDRATGEDPPHA